MIGELALVIAAIAAVCYFLRPDPQPLCGVYSQPGKFFLLKYWTFRAMYFLRRRSAARKSSGNDGGSGYGVKSRADVQLMDCVQQLPPKQPLAVDAVYFNGCDEQGYYLVMSVSRRPRNQTQAMLMLRIPSVGVLELPCAPDTQMDADDLAGFAAGGVRILPVEPMRTWRLQFNGRLRLDRGRTTVDARLNVDWTACGDCFDFDTDMDAHALATAVAREPWSRPFFQRLRDSHQTHYEQFGDINGYVDVDEMRFVLKLRGARDHSYGNTRLWSDFHRYAMQFVHTQDGCCFNAAVVSMPGKSMSRLEFGYFFTADGRKLALSSVQLPLHLLGEDGRPPDEYEFRFEDQTGRRRLVKCKVLERPAVYFTDLNDRREAVVHEQMCRYTVDGVPGWGFSEWEYRQFH